MTSHKLRHSSAEEERLLSSPGRVTSYQGSDNDCEGASNTFGQLDRVTVDHDAIEISSCSLKADATDSYASSNKKALRKLIIACVLCVTFIACEVVGGSLAHSLAIMTDAAHLVTDLISFIISLFAILLVKKGPTKRLTFGWYRAEMLGALFSIQLIWIVTGVLVYLAVERVRTMNFTLEPISMLITAGLGVLMNLIMAGVLHQKVPTVGHGHSHSFGHSHGHGHSHDSNNINVRAAFIHCIGDLLQSFGVLTAAFVVYFKPEYKIADPICTFISSAFVLGTTFFIFRDSIFILMEAAPHSIKSRDLYTRLMSIEGVSDVHNIRLWSLTTDKVACNIHMLVDPFKLSAKNALQQCHAVLNDMSTFHDVTIQVEEVNAEQSLQEIPN